MAFSEVDSREQGTRATGACEPEPALSEQAPTTDRYERLAAAERRLDLAAAKVMECFSPGRPFQTNLDINRQDGPREIGYIAMPKADYQLFVGYGVDEDPHVVLGSLEDRLTVGGYTIADAARRVRVAVDTTPFSFREPPAEGEDIDTWLADAKPDEPRYFELRFSTGPAKRETSPSDANERIVGLTATLADAFEEMGGRLAQP